VGSAPFSHDIGLPSALPFETEPPAELGAVMERFGVPAVSVAVVSGGRVAAEQAWGVRDSGDGEPATPETLFQAGSISKPVAAMCALRLVAQGGLELDVDVNELLRSWQVPANAGWQPRVTVRQLLGPRPG
jgi:CubicO group peptidase (beta-lactamase class C family)